MHIPLSDNESQIFKKIARAAESLGYPSWIVGGFVRDKILNRTTKDADIVCVGDGIALAEAAASLFKPSPFVNFFKNFGTAHFKLTLPATEGAGTEEFDIEFVGARKESYRAESRNPDVIAGSFADDQLRRDFTINTMAISLNNDNYGELADSFKGMTDIENKIIRTPLDPLRTFSDDPLRMMRAIRFAAQLDFTIEPSTMEAIRKDAGRVTIVSQERITDELNMIISTKKPSIGLDLLYQTGLLQKIFPEMVELAGAEYKDGHGHKDNFYHTLQVLDNLAKNTTDLWLRWSAILHDIAKPVTKKFEEGHGWTFHGHESVGGRMVPKIFSRLKLSMGEPMRRVRKLVELHLRPISLTKENITDSAIRRLLYDAGDDIESLMMLCEADITSKNKQKVKRYLENFQWVRQRCREVEEKDHIRNWQPPVTGEIIMETFGLPPSKPVGIIKDALKDAMLDGLIPNTREAAIEFMLEKGRELGLRPQKG